MLGSAPQRIASLTIQQATLGVHRDNRSGCSHPCRSGPRTVRSYRTPVERRVTVVLMKLLAVEPRSK